MDSDQVCKQFNKSFLFFVGLTFLVSTHVLVPSLSGSGLKIPYNCSSWLSVVCAIAVGVVYLLYNKKLVYTRLTKYILISSILLTLPVLYPASISRNCWLRIAGLWGGFLLLLMLQQFKFSRKHKDLLLWFIVISVCIEAAYGFYQYFALLYSWSNIWGHVLKEAPFGVFRQANVMASFLGTGIVVAGFLVSLINKLSEKKIWVLLALPIFSVALIIVLASRTGWLILILSLPALCFYLYKSCSRKLFLTWLSFVVLGICLGFAMSNKVEGLMSSSSKSFNRLNTVESKANLEGIRSFVYPQTIRMILKKPILGYGYGNFKSAYIHSTADDYHNNPGLHVGRNGLGHPHNETLFLASEGGIVPVIGIVIAGLGLVLTLRCKGRLEQLIYIAMLIPILIHTQLELPFYHSAVHWFVLIILFYYFESDDVSMEQADINSACTLLTGVVATFVFSISCFYIIFSFHTNWVLVKYDSSEPKIYEILDEVIYPACWGDKYEDFLYDVQINYAIKTNNYDMVVEYISRYEDVVKQSPDYRKYEKLIMACQLIGDKEREKELTKKGQFLYPEVDFSVIKWNGKVITK